MGRVVNGQLRVRRTITDSINQRVDALKDDSDDITDLVMRIAVHGTLTKDEARKKRDKRF